MIMSGDTVSVHSMLQQCLAFSREMKSEDKSFKFSYVTTNFTFNFSTMEEKKPSTIAKVRKKISPSTLRRNARRKEEYLQKKVEAAFNQVILDPTNKDKDKDNETSKQDTARIDLKCDQCGKSCKSNQVLRIHIGKAHKSEPEPESLRSELEQSTSLILTPPKDAREENYSFDENTEQTEENKIILEDKNEITKLKLLLKRSHVIIGILKGSNEKK